MYANPCYIGYVTIEICTTCDGDVVEAGDSFAVTNYQLYCIILSVSFSCLLFTATGWVGSFYAIPGFLSIVPLLLAAYRTYDIGNVVEPKNFAKFLHARNIHAVAAVMCLISCVSQGFVAGYTGQFVFEYIDRDLAGGPPSISADVARTLPGTGIILDTGLSPFIFFGFAMVSTGVMFVCMVQSIRSVNIMTSAANEARMLDYNIPDKYARLFCSGDEDAEGYDQGGREMKSYQPNPRGPQGMNRYDL